MNNQQSQLDYAGKYLRDYEGRRYTFWERNLHWLDRLTSIIVPPDAEEFYDVSFYQAGMNWNTYAQHARAVIIRIGQNLWKDTEFEYNYAEAKKRGLAVGGYWFYDGRVSPQQQVNVVIAAMQGKTFEMEMVTDWERSYGGAYEGLGNVVKFMQLLEAAGIKSKGSCLYTGYYWFTENSNSLINATQYTYLKQCELWLAWYASASVVKVPPPWTTWQHWQYGTPSIQVGQPTIEIDANKSNGTKADFTARYFGTVIPPPTDVTAFPHDGMKHISGIRYGWKFELLITDPAKVSYELVSTPQLETVPSVTARKGATFGCNAGEWDRVSSPKDYTVSNGVVVKARVESAPSFQVLGGNSILLHHVTTTLPVQQAFSGLRYLIVNGSIQDYLSGSEPQYTEGHARMIAGFDGSGHAMTMLSEGVYPNQGLILKQAAEIMKQYGCIRCVDFGGGGDVGGILDDVDLIKPENIVNGQNVYRKLPMTFLIYANNGGTMAQYEVKSSSYNMTLRPEHNTGVLGTESIPANTIMKADEIWVAPADLYKLINGINVKVNSVGDKWAHVTSVNGVAKNSWVAIIHNAIVYCSYVDTTPVPTPIISPVTHFSVDTDYPTKTLSYTRRRVDGSIDIIRDPIE